MTVPPPPSLSDDEHGRALKAAGARAATPGNSTPTPTHAHHTNRRGVFYLFIGRFSFPTNRPCMPPEYDAPADDLESQILSSNFEESRTTSEE